jgi:hypothetical protein
MNWLVPAVLVVASLGSVTAAWLLSRRATQRFTKLARDIDALRVRVSKTQARHDLRMQKLEAQRIEDHIARLSRDAHVFADQHGNKGRAFYAGPEEMARSMPEMPPLTFPEHMDLEIKPNP